MAVHVDPEKCNACLKCADVCPSQALEKTNDGTKDHIKVVEENCIDCFLCVDECKAGALTQPG